MLLQVLKLNPWSAVILATAASIPQFVKACNDGPYSNSQEQNIVYKLYPLTYTLKSIKSKHAPLIVQFAPTEGMSFLLTVSVRIGRSGFLNTPVLISSALSTSNTGRGLNQRAWFTSLGFKALGRNSLDCLIFHRNIQILSGWGNQSEAPFRSS